MAIEFVLTIAFASFIVGLLGGRGTASERTLPNGSPQLVALSKDLEAKIRFLVDKGCAVETIKEVRQDLRMPKMQSKG